MKRFLLLLVLAFICVGLAAAQTATVTRNVNLPSDLSTNKDPIKKLTPADADGKLHDCCRIKN